MIFLQTPSFGWFFEDGRQLASKSAHHKRMTELNDLYETPAAFHRKRLEFTSKVM